MSSIIIEEMLRNSPKEWHEFILKDSLKKHQAGIYIKSEIYGSGFNIIGVQNLYQINAINGQLFSLAPMTESNRKKYSLNDGDLIYSESSLVLEGIAKTLYVTKKGSGTIFAWHTRKYNIDKLKFQPAYIYYLLNSTYARKYFISVASQTALTGITTKDYFNIKLKTPPLPEQKKIAEVLTTIDNVIEKTEQLIEKLKSIKKGLMQDLFTRGVTPDGKLRPPHNDAPELYKESELGCIPKEWEVDVLKNIINIKHGYAFEGEHFTDQETPYILLTPGNFNINGDLYFTYNNIKYYKDASFPKEYILSNGDLLIVMTDLTKEMNILGNTVMLNSPNQILHNQRIGKIILKSNNFDETFVMHLINSHYCKTIIKNTATGTTVRHTSPTKIMASKIPIIDYSEQIIMSKILKIYDNNINEQYRFFNKIKTIKKGLMDDLLTGKVRVTELIKEEQ